MLSVADDSFALTLWTYWQLADIERLDRMRVEFDQLETATMTAKAFHEPNKLAQDGHRLRARHGLLPSRDTVMERAATLLADARSRTPGS